MTVDNLASPGAEPSRRPRRGRRGFATPSERIAEVSEIVVSGPWKTKPSRVKGLNLVVDRPGRDLTIPTRGGPITVSVNLADLARPEMLTATTESSLGERLLDALKKSETDWRTVGSLAEELGATDGQIRSALRSLGDKVRRPVGQEKRYSDWYRMADRGLTRQEKWTRLRAIVTSSAMDDNF